MVSRSGAPRRSTPPARRLVLLGLVLALLAGAVAGPSGVASAQSDARSERERVRSQQAEVAAQVNALQADAQQVNAALASLQADVNTQRAALSDAQRALQSAEAELARLDAEIQATEAEIAGLQDELRRYAVAAYVEPPIQSGFGALDAESAERSAQKRVFLQLKGRTGANVLDQLGGAKARLREQRLAAQAVQAEAEAHRAAVAGRTQQAEVAYQRQASFAAQVESRLNARLAEAQGLAAQDARLSDRIAAEEREVARRLAEARRRQEEDARRRRDGGGGGGGGGVVPPPIVGPGELVTVGGITVHRSIAANLRSLLAAASADGLTLGGTGWRDSQAQIALRIRNCGSSAYAIYQMPPDACSPPTAIPGRSKHERGLAVDFSCNGQIIQSRSSACFQWLAANAPSYGFINLPSEPWHWSNDGG